jgi:hypothetical protein
VRKADLSFKTRMKKGYETDRGRVFLKYGPPNTIVDRPYEKDVVPYQVWHYYKLGTLSNRRFVFYQPDLIANEFIMLHSDVPGEITNTNWQNYLVRNKSIELDPSSDYRGKSGEDFNNPR